MKLSLSIILFSLAMVLAGCVETIVMDPNEKDLPVAVHCILSNPDPNNNPGYHLPTGNLNDRQRQSMTIRYVKGKLEEGFIPVEDAKVYIEYGSGPKADPEGTISFSYVGDGVWESDPVRIYNNAKYSLFVEIPGKETIWAETTGQCDVVNAVYVPDEVRTFDKDRAKEFFLKHSLRFRYYGESSPVWVFAKEYTPNGWKDIEYLVTDSPYADDFNILGKHYSDLTLLGNGDTDDVSDERIRDVFETSKRLMAGLPLHDRYIRMDKVDTLSSLFVSAGSLWYLNLESNDYYGKYDETLAGWDITVDEDGNLVRKPKYKKKTWTWNQYIRIHFHFVNSDLDEYLRSVYIKDLGLRSDLTSLYSMSNTFTNIHGGVGIFGCDNQLVLNFTDPYKLIDQFCRK